MAEVHSDIVALLEGLWRSRLAPLAAAATDRILSDHGEGDSEGDAVDLAELTRGPPEWAQVLRQVDLVDATITYPLKQEVQLMVRLRELAKDLKLQSLAVLPRETGVVEFEEVAYDYLLSTRRENALNAFLKVWLPAINGVRARWEGRRDEP